MARRRANESFVSDAELRIGASILVSSEYVDNPQAGHWNHHSVQPWWLAPAEVRFVDAMNAVNARLGERL